MEIAGLSMSELLAYEQGYSHGHSNGYDAGFKTGVAFIKTDKKLKARKKKIVKKLKRNTKKRDWVNRHKISQYRHKLDVK